MRRLLASFPAPERHGLGVVAVLTIDGQYVVRDSRTSRDVASLGITGAMLAAHVLPTDQTCATIGEALTVALDRVDLYDPVAARVMRHEVETRRFIDELHHYEP